MISNSELSNRFDVLYNNITSSQAPGLDEYEKSVFWNKAQLEVLKNKLNPKGNKYGEGFDFSSKRQLEFSTIVKTKAISSSTEWSAIDHTPKVWCLPAEPTWIDEAAEERSGDSWSNQVISIVNESVQVLKSTEYNALASYMSTFLASIFGGPMDNISTISQLIDWALELGLPQEHPMRTLIVNELLKARDGLLSGDYYDLTVVFDESPTVDEAIAFLGLTPFECVVVPINNIEYDTLTSRPYKYPPKAQVWRTTVADSPRFVMAPDVSPVSYRMRYIKTPCEVEFHVENGNTCELPDFLIDEVLQRAVELAKAAYVGDMNHQQLIQAMGERSE